jgi:mRNA-degrading endonuclease RelE of RelBE toxin-antitoxin system
VRFTVRFLPGAEVEFLRLPARLQRQLRELVPYLNANPYRAYPFLPVREVGKIPGVWRFPLGRYWVFFKVDRETVWIGKIWLRPSAYDRAHVRELRRAFHR